MPSYLITGTNRGLSVEPVRSNRGGLVYVAELWLKEIGDKGTEDSDLFKLFKRARHYYYYFIPYLSPDKCPLVMSHKLTQLRN